MTEADLACRHGSGALPVYATPAMVALMEKTACKLLQPFLEEGESTVGVGIDVKHLKASLPGQKLCCTAKLVQNEGRKFVFDIEVRDTHTLIGTARHERFLVTVQAFMQKAEEHKKSCE